MNFGSFKFFAHAGGKQFGRFSFNKNTFKMMSNSSNRGNQRFMSLFSNKVHLLSTVRTLNSITKRGISGTAGVATGNGINLYNDPEMCSTVVGLNSVICESLVGCGFNMNSNIFKFAVLSDYLLICDALHVGQSIVHCASDLADPS